MRPPQRGKPRLTGGCVSKLFIRVGDGDTLFLASEKARESFERRIEGFLPDPDLGWEGSEGYRRAMANPKA